MATSKKSTKKVAPPNASDRGAALALSKKMGKNDTPTLEIAKAGYNPHKTGGGWDKHFAFQMSQDFASRVTDNMPAKDVIRLMSEYVPFAGWKNPAKALAAKYGLTRYEERE